MYLSVDEWNVWYRARHGEHLDGKGKIAAHLLEEHYNLEDALVAAQFLNSFIRHADSVKIANLAQIVNVIAPILTRGDEMLLQSIFYPIEMIASRGEGVSLQVRVDGPGYVSEKYGPVTNLDASAILKDGRLSVFLVNRSLSDAMEVAVNVADVRIAALESGEVVAGTDPSAENTYENPNRVVSRAFDDACVKDGVAIVRLPPLSVVAATFRLE